MHYFAKLCLSLVFVLGGLVALANAGGPENLLLVVNEDSQSSMLIANHYASLRDVPERNVVYLSDIPDREIIPVDVFKSKILKPVLQKISERKLAGNIDYIVYSADFPALINVGSHLKKLMKLAEERGSPIGANKKIYNAHASINSATYFAQAIMSDEPAYMLLNSNYYYRGPTDLLLKNPFQGDLQRKYQAAVKKIDSDPDEAIGELEDLRKQHPLQVAVLYQLARAHAQNSDYAESAGMLQDAVNNGWSFRSATQVDPLFAKAIDRSIEFQNVVAEIPDQPLDMMPSVGFKRTRLWSPNGSSNGTADQGRMYFLSTVLAVTRNYGCTERQALNALKRNAVVDGTKPSGTFYFADTKDVRNRTRKPNYAMAVAALESLGHKAKIVSDIIPIKKSRVMGLTNGTAKFNWKTGGSTLLPGAICDNLTSHGGMLNRASQTKCTEFIAAGAAGASGTVIEPFAIQAKFPHPMIHAHYARGCTLAEAFYQSVHGPFQLLIVGDALCQPFATIPEFQYEGLKSESVVKGMIDVSLDFDESPVRCKAIELYIDGLRVNRRPLGDGLKFDSSKIPDGYHELRVVAIADSPIETTGRVVFPIFINNHGYRVNLSADAKSFKLTEQVTFRVKSNYGERIELRHNFRKLAEKSGKDVEFSIAAETLGRGPIELTALAFDENDIPVSSVPLKINVTGEIMKTKRQTEAKPAKKK